jgi:DNA/RNA-binding domain of Phe-tRNA-synthetase-like protein
LASFRATNTLEDRGLLAGLVVARGVAVGPAPAAQAAELDALIAAVPTDGELPGAVSKDAVRALLRTGGYKPSGRGKPASEYLAQAARERRFPRINNLVDANNLLSLATGLPISLLDLEVVGAHAVLRFGAPGETYVFNSGGQTIDVAGLVVLCRGEDDDPAASVALGNPVKDSMAGKLKDQTRDVVGCIYAPAAVVTRAALAAHLQRFARLLADCRSGASSGSPVETETLVV